MTPRRSGVCFASWRLGVSTLVVLAALGVPAVAQDAPRFETVSIKPHVGSDAGGMQNLQTGESILTNMPTAALLLNAYPLTTIPFQFIGLPAWAESSRWDVQVKGKADATAAERQQMWRTALGDRFQLRAHYEQRERPSYDLVYARPDHTLGPSLKSSSLDCSQPTSPPPSGTTPGDPIELAMGRCGLSVGRAGLYSGGTYLPAVLVFLQGAVGRTIVDKTGLTGLVSIRLAFNRESATPDDPVVLNTIQEQLGLKLEPSTTQAQVLVIDQIKRPTDQ